MLRRLLVAKTDPECGPEGVSPLPLVSGAPNAFAQRHNWMREMILEGDMGAVCAFQGRGCMASGRKKGQCLSPLRFCQQLSC